jgi:hypothetical protein
LKTKKYYETNEFKKINREWEQKLKESGFSDIEKPDVRFSNKIRKEEIELCEKQENHFDMCREYLNSGKIKSIRNRSIFELYCEGFSIREIEDRIINRNDFVPVKRKMIHEVIKEILEDVYG